MCTILPLDGTRVRMIDAGMESRSRRVGTLDVAVVLVAVLAGIAAAVFGGVTEDVLDVIFIWGAIAVAAVGFLVTRLRRR